jgi:SAM-dependent methyltransferase
MLKRIPSPRAEELVSAAATMPLSDPKVAYPAWYLHRWHFLPEGYLSRRSAAGYDHVIRRLYNQGLESRVIQTVVSGLKRVSPGSLLEVGCGPGRLLRAASSAGVGDYRVGMDLSPYLLERARRRLGRQARLVHGDGLAIPSEDAAFDASVASHYVGHLPARMRAAAVSELSRVVRPGGHIFVVDHRWHPWPEQASLKLIETISHNLGLVTVRVFERLDVQQAPA